MQFLTTGVSSTVSRVLLLFGLPFVARTVCSSYTSTACKGLESIPILNIFIFDIFLK